MTRAHPLLSAADELLEQLASLTLSLTEDLLEQDGPALADLLADSALALSGHLLALRAELRSPLGFYALRRAQVELERAVYVARTELLLPLRREQLRGVSAERGGRWRVWVQAIEQQLERVEDGFWRLLLAQISAWQTCSAHLPSVDRPDEAAISVEALLEQRLLVKSPLRQPK